jgi:hypothetical protein
MSIDWRGFEIIYSSLWSWEDFELDILSNKIYELSQKKDLSPEEIDKAQKVCKIAQKLYLELEEAYIHLPCCFSRPLYNLCHNDRKTPHAYEELLKKNSFGRKMVFQNSWPIFYTLDQLKNLSNQKK